MISINVYINLFIVIYLHHRFAQKNNLPLLEHVTIPRVGAMKIIMDVLGKEKSDNEDVLKSQKGKSTAKSENHLISNAALGENDDQFYIDNEYNNRNSSQNSTPLATPPQTPIKQLIINNNNFDKRKIIDDGDDNENLKENTKIKEFSFDDEKMPTLKYILDITVAYPNKEPLDLGDIVTGLRKPCQTHILYRLFRSSEVSRNINLSYFLCILTLCVLFLKVPLDEEPLTKWLYDRFIEKEKLLTDFYRDGTFSYQGELIPNVAQQDVLKFLIIHLFFLVSTYFHYQLIVMLYNFCGQYILNNA